MTTSHPHFSEELKKLDSVFNRLEVRAMRGADIDVNHVSQTKCEVAALLAQSHQSAEAAEKRALSIERAEADYTDRLPELVQDLAICIINQVKDTNSTITTIELDGVTFRGELLGDYKLVITKRTAPTYKEKI